MPRSPRTHKHGLSQPSAKAVILALGVFASRASIAQGLRAAPAAPASAPT